MSHISFSLGGSPFIELNKLLKTCNVVQSGGEAKILIREGVVHVNNEREERIRCKLREGDEVVVEDILIEVMN